jgi:hypothetical protein
MNLQTFVGSVFRRITQNVERLHGVTTWKMIMFIVTTVIT